MTEFKRPDGRKIDATRPMKAKVGIVKNADGSALFQFGGTIAIAAVYGPKEMHPRNKRNPAKGTLRCTYNMNSFSVSDRIRPGPSRRSTEISKVTEWSLEPIVMLGDYAGQVVDVHIQIIQADASTRCAGINAAAMALAQAGIPMTDLVSSISIGKLDKQLVVDVDKAEEDWEDGEGATDIALSFVHNNEKLSHIQLDGYITAEQLKEAVELGKQATKKVYELQKEALKNPGKEVSA
ncbi:exosome complex exonuclease Rrp41 [archaeon]|jgi:exosome complex component RRP41|nr:exosome complex exonuclease Rrp41 [archaeon]MBT4373609.1 exosome complex exonuclease Rrp41 [archaeon]MBT4532057.1 exosome complex exonuclease Rrp41 [archaeon]MBT7001724.1 exosome complex exonuclease Rrp41 [archaeon]MBT7282384.1 exosome complex exonuclease Rrp41 [archaeon]